MHVTCCDNPDEDEEDQDEDEEDQDEDEGEERTWSVQVQAFRQDVLPMALCPLACFSLATLGCTPVGAYAFSPSDLPSSTASQAWRSCAGCHHGFENCRRRRL